MLKPVTIEGHSIEMDIDTGAVFSIISYHFYKKYFSHIILSESNINLITVTGDPMGVSGGIIVKVGSGGRRLSLVVVDEDRSFVPLLGLMNWLRGGETYLN